MNRFLQVIHGVLLVIGCATLIFLSLLFWDLHKMMPRVNQILTDTNRTVIEAGAAVGNFEKATRVWSQSSQDQTKNITAITSKAGRDLDDMHNVIVKVGTSADTLNTVLADLGGQVTTDAKQISTTIDSVQPVVINLREASANLVKVTTDPAILDSLHNIDSSTKHIDEVSSNMSGITADGKKVADKMTKDYLKPHVFAWDLIKELAPVAFYLKGLL